MYLFIYSERFSIESCKTKTIINSQLDDSPNLKTALNQTKNQSTVLLDYFQCSIENYSSYLFIYLFICLYIYFFIYLFICL